MTKVISHLEHGANYQEPEIIVIHAMGEFIGGNGWENHAVQFLDSIRLSAHSLVAPDGTNFRCREDNEGAYHAKGYNINSLGMEFLVKGVHNYGSFLETIKTPYVTEEEYQTGLAQIKEWLSLWPIKKIETHSSLSPERKVDPGTGFPMERLLNDVGMG